MADPGALRFTTVGASLRLVRNLWGRIAAAGNFRASHIVHPTYDRNEWARLGGPADCHFFREDLRLAMPEADPDLLASLEGGEEVPTIHNMILGDRVVCRLPYDEALRYATFLVRRLETLYRELSPAVVIGDFDALHSALGLAVARQQGLPWFALNFSVIPRGYAAFCSGLTPATAVMLEPGRKIEVHTLAEQTLQAFESRTTRAPAYLPPHLLSPGVMVDQVPAQLQSLFRVLERRRLKAYRKYSDYPKSYSLTGMLKEAARLRKNLLFLRGRRLMERAPPGQRYAFFGLHMQPEASIDVFAYFFSNQLRVVELMSRSLPPTHALLVKLHKSDVPNYSNEYLARLARFPGVRLISPYADTHELIRNADLVFAIQGTIGLEAALLGRPVIMFGDSPTLAFPSVSQLGNTTALPALVRAKLAERRPERERIVDGFAAYLAPFHPASHNDWNEVPGDAEIENYVRLFRAMERYISSGRRACA
jgi:hypothetical protein